jgi:hypothetical protein
VHSVAPYTTRSPTSALAQLYAAANGNDDATASTTPRGVTTTTASPASVSARAKALRDARAPILLWLAWCV